MNRRIQSILMLLLGGAILRIAITGEYQRYVKHGLRPLLLLSGAFLIILAALTLWYELRSRRPATAALPDRHASPPPGDSTPIATAPSDRDAASSIAHDDGHAGLSPAAPGPLDRNDGDHAGHNAGHDDGHGHAGGHEPGVGWLLLLPALALLTLSPPALSAFAAGKSGTVVVSSESDYPPLPPGPSVPVTLLDYSARSLYDNGRSMTGRTVQLDGFITPGENGGPVLARIVLTCCAADGRPVKVGLGGKSPTGLAAGTWIQVEGTYSPHIGADPINKAKIPFLTVTAWHEIPAPQNPYD